MTSVDVAEDSGAASDRKEKKRKRDGEAGEGKKDKKKRKQEVDAAAVVVETSATDEPGTSSFTGTKSHMLTSQR